MKLLSVALALLVIACTPLPKQEMKYSNVPITIQENPSLLKPGERGQARLKYDGDKLVSCTVILRKYPECLLHEVRHCTEGNWHEGRESTQDC